MIRSARESLRTFASASASAFGICLAAALASGLAAAQAGPTTPGRFAADALVGDWAIEFPNQGGPPVIGTVTYRPDGSYQETLIIGGETAGWWRGVYAVAPDGTLVLDESATSPQLCFAGACQPNDPPTRTVAQLVAVDPSSFSATFVDESGMPATLTYQEMAGAVGPTAVGPGGAPGAAPGGAPAPASTVPTTTVPATTVTASPLAPGPAAPDVRAPPAAPDADPWIGTWSDGDVTVRIGGDDGAILEVGGAVYPLSISGDDARLAGTFESGGQRYDIALQRTPDGVTVTSGGATYALRPTGAASGSGNPLAGP